VLKGAHDSGVCVLQNIHAIVYTSRYLKPTDPLMKCTLVVMPWSQQGGYDPGDVLYGVRLACGLVWKKLSKSNLRER
jgi:hypothetical protein